MIPPIQPPSWQAPPDPEPALYACLDCEHEQETDQLVETCERCESDNLMQYDWNARSEEWTL